MLLIIACTVLQFSETNFQEVLPQAERAKGPEIALHRSSQPAQAPLQITAKKRAFQLLSKFWPNILHQRQAKFCHRRIFPRIDHCRHF